MRDKIVIGTRGSKLALWQAFFTKDKLEEAGFNVEVKIIKTKGDQIQHLSFDKIEGKGFFTKEIEDALLHQEIDLAVHSSKDLSTASPEGLTVGAFSYRAAPYDTLLIRKESSDLKQFLQIKKNGVVGTSSARRKAQLLSFRNDISLKDIRGNVPTRINKLRNGDFDAILLAAAGLNRLELDTNDLIRIDLSPTMFIPAPAQGILAYQVRSNEEWLQPALNVLNDENTSKVAELERTILNAFQGGCQMPLGVYAAKEGDNYNVWVSKAESWNSTPTRMHFVTQNQLDTKTVLDRFNAGSPKSVFISRDLSSHGFLETNLKGLGHQLFGTSFIDFKPTEFSISKNYDWIFFPSKNSVRYFFKQPLNFPKETKFATVNEGTKLELQKLGHKADFVGAGGSLSEIAKAFDKTSGNNVLFARAKHSKRSIQGFLQNKKVDDIVVYDNFIKDDIKKQNASILIFTSSMNAEGYLRKHKILENQQVIAIGNSTAKTIHQFGYECSVAYEPTMWAVLDCICMLK